VLVNNAGTPFRSRSKRPTLEEMDRVIDINVRGVFIATQAALKHMKTVAHHLDWFRRGRALSRRPGLCPMRARREP